MTDDRFILVFHPADDEAPTSLRTYTRDEALQRAGRLSGITSRHGRWAVHELSDEVTG